MEKYDDEIVLINTMSWQDYTYEDYLEFCNDNGIEPKEEDSHEFNQWTYEESCIEYEFCIENIKSFDEYKNAHFVITGTLGLWNGRPEVVPEKVVGLWNAINRCYGDCDDIIVKLNKKTGVIEVQAMHHDGTNHYEIHLLRDYCIPAYNRAYDAYWFDERNSIELKAGWFQKIRQIY